LVISLFLPVVAWADDPSEALDFFEKEIRPLLVKRCYECHGKGSDIKGGLRLTSRAALLHGGDTGAAVTPGKPGESLLLEAVRYQGFEMPPQGKLPEEDVAKLARWIEIGAPWPADDASDEPAARDDKPYEPSDEQRAHWSFQPIAQVTPPDVVDQAWPAGEIDRFVLSGLETRGLRPNPPAERHTLLRRVTYDLTGLPPTPEETAAFLADTAPDALAKVVDRLLASPHYGERWGRHWLDVVRYADTAGETGDYPAPLAYKYRNWVIDALNADLPYDEFIRQQIAGDLLAAEGPPEQYAARVTATGFVAISRRFGFDPQNYQHLTISDTLDVVGRSILGLSIGCARCHHHKYDPIATEDYYALYGIFSSTRYAFPGGEETRRPKDMVALVPPVEVARLEGQLAEELAKIDQPLKQLEEQQTTLKTLIAAPPPAEALAPLQAAAAEFDKQIGQKKSEREQVARRELYDKCYGVVEGTPADAHVQKRGEPTRPGAEVPRHFVGILGGDRLPEGAGSGRRQLAEWLVRASNPLTPRVIVNRVWHYHFGKGLVATTNDLGIRGRRPTHPALLDYLASKFVAEGWSLKRLHREIVLSRAYQMSSADEPHGLELDPESEYLWRFDRQRLDAEAIRDSVLLISGDLNAARGGPHPFPPVDSWNFSQHMPFKAVYDHNQRSVYLMVQRIQRHPFLALFDGADPNASTSERTSTTTPSQALYLMNDPFMHHESEVVAARVLTAQPSDRGRIDWLYQWALARAPREDEFGTSLVFLDRYVERLQALNVPVAAGEVAAESQRRAAWAALARVVLSSNEFLYLD
jgi:Protein of unknown function (DUF1553)/Protein of unknown function (DUF1549)/Planctomycete cytochrome C